MKTDRFLTIQVTQTDIDQALKKNSARCVVATAVAKSIPDARRIEVDMQTIRYTAGDGDRMVWITPYAVQGYVVAFDAGDEIHPFSFRLYKDQRVTTPRLKLNAPAKAINRARVKANDSKKAVAKAQIALEQTTSAATQSGESSPAADVQHASKATPAIARPRPQHSAAEIDLANAKLEVARDREQRSAAEFVQVRDLYKETAQSTRSGAERSMPMPRIHKTGAREYGSRVLRVNRSSDQESGDNPAS